jgi:hypothetical protein
MYRSLSLEANGYLSWNLKVPYIVYKTATSRYPEPNHVKPKRIKSNLKAQKFNKNRMYACLI